MKRNAAHPPWSLLGGVTALGPIAMGLHIPGIDDMTSALGETVLRVQLSVPVFTFVFGFGMLGAGDIVDRVGLRLALGSGLLVFSLGAIIAGSTTGLPLLLLGRALMGAGAAFVIVVPRVAVATDPAQTTNGLARLAVIQSAVPALAPLLGAALVAWLGWRATFLLPGAVAVALFAVTIRVIPKHERSFGGNSLAPQASSYAWLGSRAWLLPTIEIAIVTAVFLILLAQTSSLLVRPFGLGATEVGIVLALTGGAFVVGSVLLARAKDSSRLRRGSRVAFVGAMVMLAVGGSSVLVWAGGLVVYALANGVLVPAAFGRVALAAPAAKGRALGAAGAIQMLVGSVGGIVANSLGGLTPSTFGAGGALAALTILGLAEVHRGSRP